MDRLRQDVDLQQESHLATERRLRARVATAERQFEVATTAQQAAESRAAELEAAHHAQSRARLDAEKEAARMRDLATESRREVRALQDELMAARDQLEAFAARDARGTLADEAAREGAAQRATLAEECRGLRKEVGRLESCIMEEKVSWNNTCLTNTAVATGDHRWYSCAI